MTKRWILLALLAGCGGGDECTPAWRPVTEEHAGVFLSAWGSGTNDVYLVGGGLGVEGIDAVALHYDGAEWTSLPTGRAETLWWVWGAPGGTDVWMVGERGLILRWDGSKFTTVASPVDATLYGVWGTSSDDVWIVGGMPGPEAEPDDVVLHWDGSELTADPDLVPKGVALFKVWGASADDVWFSGELGTLLHHGPDGWEDHSEELATSASLFTVHGCSADEVYVVGGNTAFAYDGSSWSAIEDAVLGASANGVSCGAEGVLIVGNGGLKLRLDRATGEWLDEQFDEPYDDFHGAWVEPGGRLWAVGGNFIDPASVGVRLGAIGTWGREVPGAP